MWMRWDLEDDEGGHQDLSIDTGEDEEVEVRCVLESGIAAVEA